MLTHCGCVQSCSLHYDISLMICGSVACGVFLILHWKAYVFSVGSCRRILLFNAFVHWTTDRVCTYVFQLLFHAWTLWTIDRICAYAFQLLFMHLHIEQLNWEALHTRIPTASLHMNTLNNRGFNGYFTHSYLEQLIGFTHTYTNYYFAHEHFEQMIGFAPTHFNRAFWLSVFYLQSCAIYIAALVL